VCLVTDRRRLDSTKKTVHQSLTVLERWLDAAIDAGVTHIQIRERDLEARDLAGLVRRVVDRAGGTGTAILVNDRADVVRASGADGVHLRADGPPSSRVRDLVGGGVVIGRSVHDLDEVRRERAATDYLLFGSVHASASKPPGHDVAGVAALRQAIEAAQGTPVVAIGGVSLDNVAAVAAAGAAGVAGIGIFLPAATTAPERALARTVQALAAAFSDDGTSGSPESVV